MKLREIISGEFDSQRLKSAVMISMPYEFALSEYYKNAAQQLAGSNITLDTNEDFISYWERILPLYFLNDISTEHMKILTSDGFWKGNEEMDSDVPGIDNSVLKIKATDLPVLFLGASHDLRLPADNTEWIEANFPGKLIEISNSSHFPMMENEDEVIHRINQFLKEE